MGYKTAKRILKQQKGPEVFMHARSLTSSPGRDGAIQWLNGPLGSKPLPRMWIGFPGCTLCVCRLIFTPLKLQPGYPQGVFLLDGGLCFAAFTCTFFDCTATPRSTSAVAPDSVIAEVPVTIRLRSMVSRGSDCITGVKSRQTKSTSF